MTKALARPAIVMTGATSGLGACAVGRLAREPDAHVIVGARGVGRRLPTGVDVLPLDLASLASVRKFAHDVLVRLDGTPIDALVLNAGVLLPATARCSADGFELSFAVNHLAHYLLVRLLGPHISDHGRLVMTIGSLANRWAGDDAWACFDPRTLSRPAAGGTAGGLRAFAASKRCSLMNALYVRGLSEFKARNVRVVAFDPGLTRGSANRDTAPSVRASVAVAKAACSLLGLARPVHGPNSALHAGTLLATAALGDISPPRGQICLSLVGGAPHFPEPCQLVQRFDAQRALWRASAAMVGIHSVV